MGEQVRATDELVVYDKAKWHLETCDEEGLDEHQAFARAGYREWLARTLQSRRG